MEYFDFNKAKIGEKYTVKKNLFGGFLTYLGFSHLDEGTVIHFGEHKPDYTYYHNITLSLDIVKHNFVKVDEMAIKQPAGTRIFVFGSNLAGMHGAGSARAAVEKHDAEYGVGYGRTGSSFAIPTKDHDIQVMSLERIKPYVEGFIQYAKDSPHLVFDVVAIGCGLSGYEFKQIAPMFVDAPANVEYTDSGFRASVLYAIDRANEIKANNMC